MDDLKGKTVEYPYPKRKRIENSTFVDPHNEPYRIVHPDYRYVPNRLIIQPFTHSQKEAMLFNVKY